MANNLLRDIARKMKELAKSDDDPEQVHQDADVGLLLALHVLGLTIGGEAEMLAAQIHHDYQKASGLLSRERKR